MDGNARHQTTVDELAPGHRHPMINPEGLPIPVGIFSMSDGVVVYANAAFRKIIKSTKVGEPVKGLLHTPAIRNSVAKQLKNSAQYIRLIERPQVSQRFTITKDLFLGVPHFFVCIEDVKNTTKEKQSYLSREEFIDQLSTLDDNCESEDSNVCTFDIDRFKVVNENYGYQAGNYILQEMVKMIKQYLPDNHIIGRLGGNEFGVILKDVSTDETVRLCEEIRQQVEIYSFNYNGDNIEITLSIGVISIARDQSTIEEILAASNLALLAAQENGRNCVHRSENKDTMIMSHTGIMRYAMIIEDALQNNKFELYAQPIVSLDDQSNHHSYEVLLRMYDHNIKEFVSSQELIAAAESLEVTTRIDQWVCEEVFKDISERGKNGETIPNISINLSGHSIVNVAFEKFLLGLTEKYKAPTSRICFEITESVAVKSITRAQKFISSLKAKGYKFSLDDFGVGYCSFNYLNQLDVDNVKIDGTFVSAMLDDATQFATVQAITNVARTMNIKTIAEYVEKPEIIKALKVIGVDYGQGYIFGKPSPIKDIFK